MTCDFSVVAAAAARLTGFMIWFLSQMEIGWVWVISRG